MTYIIAGVLVSSFTSPAGPLHDACNQLVNSICPLFVLTGPRKPFLIGTGVPLQIGSVSVIATAAHVLARIGRASVLTFSSSGTIALSGERRGFGFAPGQTADVDLAVIVLTDEERDELRKRVTFSYSIDFESLPAERNAFYGLIGFPHSRNKVSPRLLREPYAVATYFITRAIVPLSKVGSPGKYDQVHFALGAPRKTATGANGRPTGFPAPAGISGGGVWQLDISRSATAAPVPRLVGIGIEYCKHPAAFVCTRIENVSAMVADLQSPAAALPEGVTTDNPRLVASAVAPR